MAFEREKKVSDARGNLGERRGVGSCSYLRCRLWHNDMGYTPRPVCLSLPLRENQRDRALRSQVVYLSRSGRGGGARSGQLQVTACAWTCGHIARSTGDERSILCQPLLARPIKGSQSGWLACWLFGQTSPMNALVWPNSARKVSCDTRDKTMAFLLPTPLAVSKRVFGSLGIYRPISSHRGIIEHVSKSPKQVACCGH